MARHSTGEGPARSLSPAAAVEFDRLEEENRFRSKGDRDSFMEVGEATRKAIAAAMAAGVPASSHKVLLAVIAELTSYTRLWDAVSRRQLAERAQVSERQMTRLIAPLVKCEAVVWRPGHRFLLSMLSIRHHVSGTSECPTDDEVSGTSECPTGQEVSGTSSDDQRDTLGGIAGHLHVPLPWLPRGHPALPRKISTRSRSKCIGASA